MKFAIVFFAVLAVSSAQFDLFAQRAPQYRPFVTTPRPAAPVVNVNRVASNDQNANTIRFENNANPDGSYSYAYETDNGIGVQEQGDVRDFGGNPPARPVVAQGSYVYTSPEGIVVRITYTADENGFQPQGDAIPTPPAIPEAILRSLEYNEKNPSQKK